MARCSFDGSTSLLLVLGALAGCGEEILPPPGPPTTLAGTSTTTITGVVGTTVDSLRVRVTDADGRGVPGVSVDFRVTAGNGSIAVPPPPADSVPSALRAGAALISTTNFDGFATASWTLGTQAGSQAAAASVVGLTTIDFLADADPDVPATTVITSSSAFIGIAGGPADGPIGLSVSDQYGNPVAGVPVSWAAGVGGGSVSAAAGATDSSGVSQVTVTLGPAYGIHLFTATAQGFPVDTLGLIAVTGVAEPVDGQDPGDPSLVSHDVTFFGAANAAGILVFYLRFVDNVVPATASGTQPGNAMWALLDFDLDQDTTTGYFPSRRCNNIDSLAFGSDGFVILDPRAVTGGSPGAVLVGRVDSLDSMDRCAAGFFGQVASTVPVFRENTVTLGIDLSFLDDDGIMDFTSAIVSAGLNALTDLVPDSVPHVFDLSVQGSAARLVVRIPSLPRPLSQLFGRPSLIAVDPRSPLMERLREARTIRR